MVLENGRSFFGNASGKKMEKENGKMERERIMAMMMAKKIRREKL